MKQFRDTKPIWFALFWVFIYILLVNIGDNLVFMTGIENSITSIILVIYAIILLVYLKRNNWIGYYGIKSIRGVDFKNTLFYIPLIPIAFMQYAKGINYELSFLDFVISCVLMICVGFIEELLFRGFLFQGILKHGGVNRAVMISGVTFGIGHIVNLIRGYSLQQQGIQIFYGIVLGIVLAYIVAVTGNILPGVVFHTLLNISGTITKTDMLLETYFTIPVIIICIIYAMYLRSILIRQIKTSMENLV